LFLAVQQRFPAVIQELRDIAPDELEGIHVVTVDAFERAAKITTARGGEFRKISSSIEKPSLVAGTAPMRPAIIVDDEFGEAPHVVCVFTPATTADWARKWSLPGWDVPLSKFFDHRNSHAPPVMYAYDFGDDRQHVLAHEGLQPAEDNRKYPRCVAGEGRCPPEDCGGVHGYAEFLQVIADPDHEEHESTLRRAGGQFDPGAFDPTAVKFDDPKKRWKKAFGR
jgi:hypothetical protein